MPTPVIQERRDGYPAANRDRRPSSPSGPHAPVKEPALAQIASFVGFFVWLLTFKSFFLPLFIIPTGSMAESLCGAHASHTCPNCGRGYQIGFQRPPSGSPGYDDDPRVVRCPNCRWEEEYRNAPLQRRLQPTAGDRIVVHGWPYVFGGSLGPQRWDVVVFKNPNEPAVNYIKRLIGLPGEKIEIIDGDIFVNDRIARKTPTAQRSLWLPYYDLDFRPRRPGFGGYNPRWIATAADTNWRELDSRAPRFDGINAARGEIGFATAADAPGGGAPAGEVTDVYGYNQIGRAPSNTVRDVRLSATIAISEGEGFVELRSTKFADAFSARLFADGRITLEHEKIGGGDRTLWGEARIGPPTAPVRFALSNVDYVVSVEVDGRPLIESTPAQYSIEPGLARSLAQFRSNGGGPPVLRIAAERVRAALRNVQIERDIYYTYVVLDSNRRPGHGVTDSPIQLGSAEYFVLGDNSPASQDSRYWETPGPHLQEAWKAGEYQSGTVPADQMIGRAFLVYWPGFLPLYSGGPNVLPDLGRVRWIR